MASKRTILIVEDNSVNISILKKILSVEYDILTAENGRIALDMLRKYANRISAMILDVHMPVLDGFEVLKEISKCPEYSNIPVIVATGNNDQMHETKALSLGAWDYVTKPYNPKILKFRLQNAIERSKLYLFEQLQYQSEHNALTGLYNAHKFYQVVGDILEENPDKQYVMIHIETRRFEQFSALYSIDARHSFLKYAGEQIKAFGEMQLSCIYAHIEADNFAICTDYQDAEELADMLYEMQNRIAEFSSKMDLVMVYGLYYIEDPHLPVCEMLERASTAAKRCTDQRCGTIAVYDEAMGIKRKKEKEIVDNMKAALKEEQFCVYYQPKYNIVTGLPYGAEALVRWIHPVEGMILPGVFIPLFEENGFIADVDYFVWRKTCENLRRWCESGWNPAPVSVNVSRVNLNNPRIVEILVDLVKQYKISPHLLQLEITETSYMDNPEIMDSLVKRFHEYGFTILMDDFGSGYSSLNTLKDISVDILKIDMKFLPTGDGNRKSEKILTSVIRMADWIGMSTIIEGVETEEQRDFLKGVGCVYAQGYLFAKPMPMTEYEAIVRDVHNAISESAENNKRMLELDAFLSADPYTEAILRGLSIPVAIFEYGHGRYDRLRANQSYFDTFGNHIRTTGECVKLTGEEHQKAVEAFESVITVRGTAACEVLFITEGGQPKWYRINMKYVMPCQNSHIVCAVYTDISQQKTAQAESYCTEKSNRRN